jgi:lantibiotic modifying enzyme
LHKTISFFAPFPLPKKCQGESTMPRGIAWTPQEDELPLAGISHGNAGIALSLLHLAAVTGDERYQQNALAALEYERSLFSAEKRNWPDLRETDVLPDASSQEDLKYMLAWCHGAPGVGLARLASLQYRDDAAIRAEIDAAIQATLAEGFGRNHSLCRGDMGNLDLPLLATQLLPERLCSSEREEGHGWLCPTHDLLPVYGQRDRTFRIPEYNGS